MQSRKFSQISYTNHFSSTLYALRRRFHRFFSRIRLLVWRRSRAKLVIRRLGRWNSKSRMREKPKTTSQSGHVQRPIRIASFNAALFSLAPDVPKPDNSVLLDEPNARPKGILKQSPIHPMMHASDDEDNKVTRSKPKVLINLPENEISLAQNKVHGVDEDSSFSFNNNSLAPMRSPIYFSASMSNWLSDAGLHGSRTIFDVLKEVDADILALQDVKADEEKDMKPLSDLARALGMNYAFAESWAPEYGNAVLSKWPIKKWKVQRIYDDRDFRNVIKATIDVPWTGELDVYCTQLDHLDENWRTKQINAIIERNEQPYILAGGLNSLDTSDYSLERWNTIVKYYEELGKPTPKAEVTSLLKQKKYTDAKDFTGECEPLIMIAKGQSRQLSSKISSILFLEHVCKLYKQFSESLFCKIDVQGTCKYGTRVDYIFGSPGLRYAFVPGSYSVFSSRGTSDHHIVKVDIVRVAQKSKTRNKRLKQRVVRLTNSCSSGAVQTSVPQV